MIITQALTQIGIAFFRAFRQIKWYSLLLVGKATLELSLIVCLLMIDWKLIGIITAILTSDIVFIFIIFFLVFKQVGFEMPRFTRLMSYLRYGLPLVPSSAILWITHFSDRYIIGYFMEAKEVGIYSAAYALSNLLIIFIGPLQVTLLPTISKSYQEGDKDRTEVYLNYSWKFLIMLSIPAVFGISIMAVPLLSTLTTSEFINGNTVIPLIATGILFYSLYQVCIHIFYLVNKTSWILSILGLASVFNVGLNLLLVPRFGIVGAGVANMLANGLVAILTVYISFKYFKFDLNPGFIIKSVIASSLMALTIWFLNPSKIYQIITSILLGIIIYTVLLLVLKGIDKNEFRFLKNLVMGFNTAGNKY
jgi:O-antigen/teichoic acid export membrane protein